ncbi:MAG: hypothetical protein MAGBODY4_01323 [Candidatus Marinimicrobia bacterium]|nr:hypothetical protein [Candidatus Neomarinimicrobiota bacterium]
MRHTIKIYAMPLWPLVKNVFIISWIVFTLITLIFGLFWIGFMRQFAATFSGAGAGMPMEAFQDLGGMFVIMFAIFYGIFGSVVFTVLTGLGGLIYNWMNRQSGGLEFEISLPDSLSPQPAAQQSSGPDTPEPPKEIENTNDVTESDSLDDDTR